MPIPQSPPIVTTKRHPENSLIMHDEILLDDLRKAWRHAVRAYNFCENQELSDTQKAVGEIVLRLSQQLEFCDCTDSIVAERRGDSAFHNGVQAGATAYAREAGHSTLVSKNGYLKAVFAKPPRRDAGHVECAPPPEPEPAPTPLATPVPDDF